jgi:hypothetical protein
VTAFLSLVPLSMDFSKLARPLELASGGTVDTRDGGGGGAAPAGALSAEIEPNAVILFLIWNKTTPVDNRMNEI